MSSPTPLPPGQVSQSKPVLVTFSILAGLQVLAGGAALGDVVGPEVFGIFVLVVAAVQAGMSFFVHNRVTPWADVVAKEAPNGAVVAGPASHTKVGREVVVHPVPPPH